MLSVLPGTDMSVYRSMSMTTSWRSLRSSWFTPTMQRAQSPSIRIRSPVILYQMPPSVNINDFPYEEIGFQKIEHRIYDVFRGSVPFARHGPVHFFEISHLPARRRQDKPGVDAVHDDIRRVLYGRHLRELGQKVLAQYVLDMVPVIALCPGIQEVHDPALLHYPAQVPCQDKRRPRVYAYVGREPFERYL